MLAACEHGPGAVDPYTCQADTPNLDRITAALDQMDETTHRMAVRVHNIESEMQSEALWAAVDFIEDDGWTLSVLAGDGVAVHEWGTIAPACVGPCLDPEADTPLSDDCRAVGVGSTGHILCGSRERQ